MTELTPTDENFEFIISGIAGGFKLVDDMSIIRAAECVIYKSALSPTVKSSLDKLFREELFNDRILLQHAKPIQINAIKAVPKKEAIPSDR